MGPLADSLKARVAVWRFEESDLQDAVRREDRARESVENALTVRRTAGAGLDSKAKMSPKGVPFVPPLKV